MEGYPPLLSCGCVQSRTVKIGGHLTPTQEFMSLLVRFEVLVQRRMEKKTHRTPSFFDTQAFFDAKSIVGNRQAY